MTYLAKDPELRFDPRRLDARYKSVVSLGYPYAAPATPTVDWRAEMRGQNRGVRARPRLSRRRQEAGARSRRRAPPTSSRLDHAHLRRYRAGVRARMGIGFAHRMVRQEHDDSQSRSRLVLFPRRDFYRRGIRRGGRAVSRPLRDVPAMPRSVSDRRAGRRLRDALGAVHLVSDDRKSRRDSARAAAQARQLDLRLRHLQRRLPMERRSCVRPRAPAI